MLTFSHSCKREWSNPYDDLPPDIWAPQNFSVTDVSITEKQLSWSYGEFNIEGFKLDRKKGDEEWQVEYRVFNKETRDWAEDELVPDGTTYQYKLFAYAGSNVSTLTAQSMIALLPAPSNLFVTPYR